jgi:hypothetical protein
MIKYPVTYTNWDDETVTETLRFHLSQPDMVDLNNQFEDEGGFTKHAEAVLSTKSSAALTELYKTMLLKAYGELQDDGTHFVKSPELSKAFTSTAAYAQLFYELLTDEANAQNFFTQILPKDLAEKVSIEMQKQAAALPTNPDLPPLPTAL